MNISPDSDNSKFDLNSELSKIEYYHDMELAYYLEYKDYEGFFKQDINQKSFHQLCDEILIKEKAVLFFCHNEYLTLMYDEGLDSYWIFDAKNVEIDKN